MKKINLLILGCILLNQLAYSQFTNDTLANTIIRDSIGTSQLLPLSTTTSAGLTYISWFDYFDNEYQLRMQLLDVNGNKLWAKDGLIVSAYPQASSFSGYDLKVDHDDNAIVAFQDERNGNLQSVAYKINLSGTLLWGSAGVSLTDSSADAYNSTICITQTNDIIVAWNASFGSSKWISFQKISAAGSIIWSKRIFDNTNAKKYSRAVMVPYGSDDFTMLYVQEVGGFSGTSTLFAQHYDANGIGVWNLPKQVSTKTISFFFIPHIISDTKNGFFIAFDTSNPISLSLNDVYAQHVDSLGNLWSPSGTECANSTQHKLTGGFCYSEVNNEFYVSMQVLNSSQSDCGVYLQKMDASGNVLLGANALQLIAISPNYYASIGLVDAGDGLITIYYSGSGGGVLQKIAAKKTDYAGVDLWAYDPTICNFLSNKDDYSTGLFKNNQCVVVWNDKRYDEGIYAQNISGDGLFGMLTSVKELKNNIGLVLYPNPSANVKVEITSNKNESVRLSVFNSNGKLCLEKPLKINSGNNVFQLDGKNLTDGLYLVSIATSEGVRQVKWVKSE